MKNDIIAAAKDDVNSALISNVNIIFYLNPNIMNIGKIISDVHKASKRVFFHFDLAEGIGKDRAGLMYLKELGADGIISTRVNIIKMAKECGLKTVQRFFIVDSHSIDTTIEAVKTSKPDMIELMPGTLTKIIAKVKEKVNMPVIAGGLIETKEEVMSVFNAGAGAVSTSKSELWE